MTNPTHDENTGRFLPGNPGGPGRPPRAKELDYLRTLAEICTLSEWEAICQRAVKDAREGEPRARAWLTQVLVGNHTLINLECAERSRGIGFSRMDRLFG